MQIAILGAGKVGTTLGRRFMDVGHEVRYGVRAPEDPKHDAYRSQVGSLDAVAAGADMVVLTTSWAGAHDALVAAGDLSGKILVDATNPIGPGMVLTHGTTDSGAEQVARWSPGARVVKAFNSIGREVMANATFPDGPSVLWLCGDEEEACSAVAALASAMGFAPLRIGGLARARVLEPSALLWILSSGVVGTREFSWGVLRR